METSPDFLISTDLLDVVRDMQGHAMCNGFSSKNPQRHGNQLLWSATSLKVSFEDILVSFSLQRLNCILDHCTYVHGLALLLLC